MFPSDVLIAYLAAVVLVVLAPGPGNILAIGRGLGLGLRSNLLDPKPGPFVVAFVPRFVSESRGSVAAQMRGPGAIFALVTALVFTLPGAFAAQRSAWLRHRPRAVGGPNVGAGLTFIGAGLSALALQRQG